MKSAQGGGIGVVRSLFSSLQIFSVATWIGQGWLVIFLLDFFLLFSSRGMSGCSGKV
jgi:hypothetical protein